MECVNCMETPQNRSLTRTSNVLDNFEHTKCGELLQPKVHENKKENKILSDAEEKQNNCHNVNSNNSMWLRSCEKEVVEPLRSTNVTGNIPKWLQGTLLRNGPGSLKVGKYSYQHLFDSSALLHKFKITDGEITYQRRFIQTEVYKRNQAAQRIVFNEFGTYATPDPCHSIFRRMATMFKSSELDNSLVSVYPFNDEYYTFTEMPVMHRIDPKSLETMGRVNVSQYVNIVNHTSHPHVMTDGTIYNVGLSVTSMGPKYNVVCFYPDRETVDNTGKKQKLSMFDQATIVASVPSRRLLNPSYMHTFGITKNYFIIVEQPLSISFMKRMMARIKQELVMVNSLKWHDNKSTLIHVISRETGKTIRTFVSDTFFYFHIINQFETSDGEYVVLDICCYRNPKMLEYMYIDSLKNMYGDAEFKRSFRARPLRFVLPMKELSADTSSEHNLITIKTVHQNLENSKLDLQSVNLQNNFIDETERPQETECRADEQKSVLWEKPAAHRLPNGRIFVRPELLCDVGCELPRINTNGCLGREYRYFYAISDTNLENSTILIKIDTYSKTKKIWEERGVFPSEPIFIPNPNGKNEDDGVVVSSLIWSDKETQAGLLILDAVTFTEIARATFDTPGPVPKCLHDFEWAVKLNRIALEIIDLWPTIVQNSPQQLMNDLRVLFVFIGLTFIILQYIP